MVNLKAKSKKNTFPHQRGEKRIIGEVKKSHLVIRGGNVGGGVTAELGISFPEMPMPCSCSGRNDDDLNCRPAIFLQLFSVHQ